MQNSRTMTVSDVSYTMSLTRQVLEKNRLKNQYQLLNFYCNWCLHPELTKSMHCYWILEQIADALVVYADQNPNDFTKRISEIISFKNLKQEINALYKEKRIPRFLFKIPENWHRFITLLIQTVKEKPIKFPDKIKITAPLIVCNGPVELGEGATKGIARLGDLVTVGSGSSAGDWPITSVSNLHKAT